MRQLARRSSGHSSSPPDRVCCTLTGAVGRKTPVILSQPFGIHLPPTASSALVSTALAVCFPSAGVSRDRGTLDSTETLRVNPRVVEPTPLWPSETQTGHLRRGVAPR